MMLLQRYTPKAEVAFLLTFQAVWESSNKHYFWTFTPHCQMADWQFSASWKRFIDRWNRWGYGDGFRGVRVFEPFQSGFLHCHAVVNRRIAVEALRRVAEWTGIGRIHVRRARPYDAEYLAKYLTKARFKLPEGIRMWAKLGTWQHSAVRNIEIDSSETRLMKFAYHGVFRDVSPHSARIMAARQFVMDTRNAELTGRRRESEAVRISRVNRYRREDSYNVVTTVWPDGACQREPSYNVVTATAAGGTHEGISHDGRNGQRGGAVAQASTNQAHKEILQ